MFRNSIILTFVSVAVFFGFLMFTIGYSPFVFFVVTLFFGITVCLSIIFDRNQREYSSAFPAFIVYPILGAFYAISLLPIPNYFADKPKGFNFWTWDNVVNSAISTNHELIRFGEPAWYGEFWVQALFVLTLGALGLLFQQLFRND
ncbi:hypothetical protein [Acinetobacter haemolyticus]|uniref:hypothetical protein n=1 Tax=Acinetobacter haemolyticus TaxID=29430 RepID=UPI001331F997|nr:hypothetical protein [Acinetobacter haemolyticus]NAS02930.1 hypothetical protein [Acinetobacter haemolyticus]NAS08457.1 hypothetical protein [Acinetobacter haemolyticus]QHI29946.1 hypothetical protein AhaeINNSZ174_10920 [Acinetobacter haemolyticus]QHI32310.1 hypothetical protein Ahae11616_06450 [Acinetobacter haemolyticus]